MVDSLNQKKKKKKRTTYKKRLKAYMRVTPWRVEYIYWFHMRLYCIILLRLSFQRTYRLCLVLRKFEGKWKGKKIQKRNRKKEKMKENKKNRLKVYKLFFFVTSNLFYLF